MAFILINLFLASTFVIMRFTATEGWVRFNNAIASSAWTTWWWFFFLRRQQTLINMIMTMLFALSQVIFVVLIVKIDLLLYPVLVLLYRQNILLEVPHFFCIDKIFLVKPSWSDSNAFLVIELFLHFEISTH